MKMSNATTAKSSIFSGLASAKARVSANYVRAGHYLCKYNRIKVDKSRKQKEFVVFEMTVLKVMDNGNGLGHRVGEDVSHMLTATGNECFLGNIKTIIANICGMKPEEVTEEDAHFITADDQPLCKGTVVEIRARTIRTKPKPGYPDGTDFTEVSHCREVPAEELLVALDPKVQADFFPNNLLTRLAEETKRLAGQQQAAAPSA
jgi:hypothetical protein